ncbi:MAG: cytidylate kinase family protein [Spirochaetia bacterium]|nr:cytidylate kinase family protein [Spirochaetia bacterium]
MALITLSREEGSLSKQVGLALKENLGYDFISGKTIISEFPDKFNISISQFEKFDEKKPGLLERFTNSYEKYNNTFKFYIFEKLLKNPNCIVMGRCGTFFLKDVPGLLRIRTVGSEDIRIKRIMDRYQVDEHAAKKMVAHKELERTEQAKYLYNATWGKPSNYDLSINTDKLSVSSICAMIKGLIAELDKEDYKAAQQKKLKELYLSQKAVNTVLYEEKIAVSFLEVKIEDNKAIVLGLAKTSEEIDKAGEIVKEITGVGVVENNVSFENFASYDMGMEFFKK